MALKERRDVLVLGSLHPAPAKPGQKIPPDQEILIETFHKGVNALSKLKVNEVDIDKPRNTLRCADRLVSAKRDAVLGVEADDPLCLPKLRARDLDIDW